MSAKNPPSELETELDAVDLEPVDRLVELQKDIEVLDQRLSALEERRGKVADAVFERVQGDYSRRRGELEERATPLRVAAREQYARVRELMERCEAEHAAVELDREEIELRFGLGEFEQDERDKRMKRIDQDLAAKGRAREQAEALRERFVAAFGSREALEAEAPPPADAQAAAGPAVDSTQPLPTLSPDQIVPPEAPPPPAGATQVMRALKAGDSAGVRPDQTVILRSARLLPRNAEAGEDTVVLALKPMLFGSEDGCDVVIAALAPQHAEIRVSMAGFSLARMGGTVRVNGIELEQHLLRHKDQLDIGPARFEFSES